MSKSTKQDTISSNGINILLGFFDMKFFMFTDFERGAGRDRQPDIDGQIRLIDENGKNLELYLHYQTKSHEKITDLTKYKIKKKDVEHLTKTNVPTLFFIVNVKARKSYWYFLNKDIDNSKGITIDISKNEIYYNDSQKINLKWREIAKSNKYSESKEVILRMTNKFELNIQSCLGLLYLFGVIKKQEFPKIISDLLKIKEHESKTIIEHLESSDIISSTVNYYLLENEKLGVESLFLLLDSKLLDFENLDKHLTVDNKKIVFEQLNKINHPKVNKYFDELSTEFKNYFPEFKNNDDIFVNLELLGKYIYKTPNQAIQILKIIINSKNPLNVFIRKVKGWGKIKGKSHSDLVEKSVELLEKLRYIKHKDVFSLLLKLSSSKEKKIKEKVDKSLENMAEYNLSVMRKIGYQYQVFLLDEIDRIKDRKLLSNFDAITLILRQIIKPSFDGSEMTDYKTWTSYYGGLSASETLKKVRERAIVVLQKLFILSRTISQKKNILQILREATQTPYDNYTKELEELILGNTNTIIEFYSEVVKIADHEIVKEIEEQLHWFIKRYSDKLKNIQKLQSLIAQNDEYDIFKVFVGYDYHFDENLDWREAEKERKQKIQEFIEQISDANFDEWQNKVISVINNYNQVKDYGRYQYFNIFLNKLGKQKPEIAKKLIQNKEKEIEEFLIHLVAGIWESKDKNVAVKFIEDFIEEERHLSLCTGIFSYVKEIDEKLFKKAFEKAKQKKDTNALNKIIRSIVDNYPDDQRHAKLFIETIKELTKLKNYWWINSVWFKEELITELLSQENCDIMLENLLLVPNIDYETESVLKIIAKGYPLKIVKFFEKRLTIKSKKKRDYEYDAIPYNFSELSLELQQHAHVIIPEVLKWFKKKDLLFNWDGGNFLKNIYSISNLDYELIKLLNTENEADIKIVLSIFSTYQGHISLDNKSIQTMIRKYPKNHDDLIYSMSDTSELVSGEYGFVDLLKSRIESLQKWKKDKRKYIQDFIAKYEEYLYKQMEYEKKRADEDIELMKKGIL